MAIKFNDPVDWLNQRMNGVRHGYHVPDYFNGDGICIDIGANVGAFPLVYGKRFEKIFCYEPALYSYEECLKNVKPLGNVTVFNVAVTSVSNELIKLKSHKGGNVSGNASIIDYPDWNNESNYEYVKTVSFTDVMNDARIKNGKNYVKIDTEGSEYEMLIGVDLSMIDFLAVEIHLQLGTKKINELMCHLSEFFNVLVERGGSDFHYEITYKNRRL